MSYPYNLNYLLVLIVGSCDLKMNVQVSMKPNSEQIFELLQGLRKVRWALGTEITAPQYYFCEGVLQFILFRARHIRLLHLQMIMEKF